MPLFRSASAFAAATLAGAGALAYAAFYPQSQLFGPVLVAPRHSQDLALTLDDGPNPAATPDLLDLLGRHGVRATFFLIGRYALAQPALTRRILSEGHLLGSHTMTHPRLPLRSHARIRAELRDSLRAIEDTVGAPIHYFRPPHGARTPYVLRTALELDLVTVQWNIIGNDWTELSASGITARVENGITGNQRHGLASNIVLHDGSQHTPAADRSRTQAAVASILALHPARSFVTVDAWPIPSNTRPEKSKPDL